MDHTHLQRLWTDVNLRHFNGGLPPIEIVWSRRLTASAGLFVSHGGPRSQPAEARRRRIRLSAPLLRDGSPAAEREVLATLAHEMIHQWQYDILKRRPNHGPDFRRKMEDLNRAGLGITVRHDLIEAVQKLARYAWRCLDCGHTYERQRKTIRPGRHRCGRCHGRLAEVARRTGAARQGYSRSGAVGPSAPAQLDLWLP